MLCWYSVMKEIIAHETWHGVMWLDGEDRDKTLRRWTGCKCERQVGGFEATNHMWWGSLSKDLAPIDKATMKSKLSWDWWTNKVTWWYEVDHIFQGRSSQVLTHDDNQKAWSRLVLVWHQHLRRWNGMRKTKIWLARHFISPVKGWVEKCMIGFRIYGRTCRCLPPSLLRDTLSSRVCR